MAFRHEVLHIRRQQQCLIDIPGAKILAHSPRLNQTRSELNSDYSDRLLVRNMSDEGANLEVESQIGIPNSFDLVVDSEHSNHQCHVVWRKAHRIGVAFD